MSFNLNKDKDYKSVINKLEEENKHHRKSKRKQKKLLFLILSTLITFIVFFYFDSNSDIFSTNTDLDNTKNNLDEKSKKENLSTINNGFSTGINTSFRIDGPANFRSKASSKGDVYFSIFDNVGLDFIKDKRNNWYECGFYLSDKTNINWLQRYSKKTGNQLGEIYSGSDLYNYNRELIGKSKATIYVFRNQVSNKIILNAYTHRQNLR